MLDHMSDPLLLFLVFELGEADGLRVLGGDFFEGNVVFPNGGIEGLNFVFQDFNEIEGMLQLVEERAVFLLKLLDLELQGFDGVILGLNHSLLAVELELVFPAESLDLVVFQFVTRLDFLGIFGFFADLGIVLFVGGDLLFFVDSRVVFGEEQKLVEVEVRVFAAVRMQELMLFEGLGFKVQNQFLLRGKALRRGRLEDRGDFFLVVWKGTLLLSLLRL